MRRGFSLAEVVTAGFLMALLLALAAPMVRPQKSARSSEVSAELLSSLLRDSRQRAMSTGQVTAVGFPSDGGGYLVADNCYQLNGREHPKVLRVLRFAGESLPCQAFLGTYAGPTWSTAQPPGLFHTSTLPGGWNPQGTADPLLTFWPDGTVSSNVPHDGGVYRVVVGLSLKGDATGLQQANKPYTVSCSALGSIAVEPGIPGGNPGLLSDTPLAQPVAQPIAHWLGANQNPVLAAPHLTVSPEPQDSTLNNITLPGATATVPLGGMISVQVYASDPDGDPLTCRWTATGPALSNRFSHSEPTSMDWDPGLNCWTQRWSWSPPPDAAVGQQYQLDCEVTDNRGGSVSPASVGVTLPSIQTLTNRKIAYINEPAVGNTSLGVANWDGTNPQEVLTSAYLKGEDLVLSRPTLVRFSPNGSVLAFNCANFGDPRDQGTYVCTPGGSGLRRVTSNLTVNDQISFEWDPAGRYLYTVEVAGGNTGRLLRWEYTDTVDATPDLLFSWPTTGYVGPYTAMHPSGKLLAVPVLTGTCIIWLPTPSNPTCSLSMLTPSIGELAFTADGNSVVCDDSGSIRRIPITWNANTRTIGYSAPPVNLTPTRSDLQSPRPSRDDKWILGQTTGTPNQNILIEVATGKVMNLDFDNGAGQDGSDIGP